MKANEFVRKFGVVQSKYNLSFMLSDCQPLVLCDCILSTKEVGNLKRLVESYDLVRLYGGLESSKTNLKLLELSLDIGLFHGTSFNADTDVPRLKQAIADVESCQ